MKRDAAKPPVEPLPVVIADQDATANQLEQLWAILGPVLEPLVVLGLVLVLTVFMLINRENLRNRIIRLVGHGRLTVTTRALDDAGQRISRFLLMQFLINGAYGLLIAVGLFVIDSQSGLDEMTPIGTFAILWGFLTFVLRYIPYLGTWLTALLLVGLSVLVYPGWQEPLLVLGLFAFLEVVSNNIVEPMLFGRSVGSTEVGLLIAAAFWTWLWGPIGLLLSTPLTTCLVVLGKYVPSLSFLDILLGDQPVLETHVNYYQRLLARDEDEANDLIEEYLAEKPCDLVYDEVLIPALVRAKRDRDRGELDPDETRYIVDETREILASTVQVRQAACATPQEGPPAAEPKVLVLGCPARDEADEAALDMLRQLLDGTRYAVEVLASATLAGELLTQVEEKNPAAVCIAALPPGGLAQTRYLCKRLRARFPALKILVGRWGQPGTADKAREAVLSAGADNFATTLVETRTELIRLLQRSRAAETQPDLGGADNVSEPALTPS